MDNEVDVMKNAIRRALKWGNTHHMPQDICDDLQQALLIKQINPYKAGELRIPTLDELATKTISPDGAELNEHQEAEREALVRFGRRVLSLLS